MAWAARPAHWEPQMNPGMFFSQQPLPHAIPGTSAPHIFLQNAAPVFSFDLPPQPPRQQPEQMPANNLQATISWLTGLCSRAEKVLNEVQKTVNLSSSSSSSIFVSCPFDRRHTMAASALLQHSLRCPSSGAGLSEEAEALVSSLSYLKPAGFQGGNFDPSGTQFCYKEAPAAVRAAVFNQELNLSKTLPACITAVMGGEEQEHLATAVSEVDRLLPSQCWILQEEVKAWTHLPQRYSWNVLVSALRMKIGKGRITEWLLVNSVEHGVVLDPVLADHIFVLVKLFLAAVRREAFGVWSHARNESSGHFNCPVLLESGSWLVSQLISLYQQSAAGVFILSLLQNTLIVSARSTALEEAGQQESTDRQTKATFSEIESAMEAVKERSDLQSYLKTRSYISDMTRASNLEDYDILVSNASVERQLRPDYRPILEHDGLVWHRQNSQDASKTKTKEELLADERDYKRRRQSYKGKKVRRTPSQVLHDIIENHMSDIVAAGGIGSFNRDGPAAKPDSSDHEAARARDRKLSRSYSGVSNDSKNRAVEENAHRSSRRKLSPSSRYEQHHDDHMSKLDRRTDFEEFSKEHVRSHESYTRARGKVAGTTGGDKVVYWILSVSNSVVLALITRSSFFSLRLFRLRRSIVGLTHHDLMERRLLPSRF